MPDPNDHAPAPPEDAAPANPTPTPPGAPGLPIPREDDSDPVSQLDIERILSAAWHRFNGYDEQSQRLKKSYRQIRLVILTLSWFTTAVAVLSAVAEGLTLARAYGVIVTILLVLFSLRWFLVYHKDRDYFSWQEKRIQAREKAAGEAAPAEVEAPPAAPAVLRGLLESWHAFRARWDERYEEVALWYHHASKHLPRPVRIFTDTVTSKYMWYGAGYLLLAYISLDFAINPNNQRALLEPIVNAFDYNSKEAFKLTLVALPLISAALLAYANFFESGKAWVGIRVSAETIRRGIYTLRVLRWVHDDRLTKAALRDLDSRITEASGNLEKSGVTTPNLTEIYEAACRYSPNPSAIDRPDEDDGYSPISTWQYITWRLIPQTNWYRKRASKDYHYTRVYRFMILGVGALGAFLAAAGLGELVAVTVALANGLNALLGLRQHEFSYSIYVRTMQRLEAAYRDFSITFGMENYNKTAAQLTEKQQNALIRFVYDIEKIFNDERDLWKLSVLQGQEVTEGALAQMVNTYGTPDFDPNQYMERGFIEDKRGKPAEEDENGE
ncbi:MAG: SLATT domain-containing protein [Anaerolineae bacterium]|nr:SLATT domain-containing protein [Anaerolineae bacterium]